MINFILDIMKLIWLIFFLIQTIKPQKINKLLNSGLNLNNLIKFLLVLL